MLGISVTLLWFYGLRLNHANLYELGSCLLRVLGVIDTSAVVRWFERNLHSHDVGIVNVGSELSNSL